MGTLMDRFNQDLPVWIPEIKHQARQKISDSHFVAACRTGEISVLRELVVRFWPFVDVVARVVYAGCWRTARKTLCAEFDVTKYLDMYRVLTLSRKILAEIAKEEECHRGLWLKTAGALGLEINDLSQKPIPEIEAIMKNASEHTAAPTMFLRFTAVEIVAEAISEDLLRSTEFKLALKRPGLQWFLVHASHEGVSHEELLLRLASTFQDGEPSRKYYHDIIHATVDLFVAAGNAVIERISMKLSNRLPRTGILQPLVANSQPMNGMSFQER
jgi:pyrroloquinoline quinone (PQQ) biosynthesis protein C